MNEERLQGMPFKEIGDLAKTYQVMTHVNDDGISSFSITNEMMNMWNIEVDTIDRHAVENTETLFPVSLKCLSDLICEMLFGLQKDINYNEEQLLIAQGWDKGTKMFVLSNKFGINGASAILYKDVLKNFAIQLNSNLYILPSSIHEVIIIPAKDKLEITDLKKMVSDVNQKELAIGEVLSNEVYFYDWSEGELRIANV